MPYPLFDTHAHLDDNRFRDDLPDILHRAAEVGVRHILTIGIDRETSEAAVALTEKYPVLRAAVAIQPNHVHEAQPGDWERIQELAKRPNVAAIGETGLDRYWKKAPFDLQIDYFFRHLEYAHELQLPVVIHNREAEADILPCLKAQFEKRGPISGIMHSFTADLATAQKCLEYGLHISFAGMVTFKNADALRAVAKEIPEDRLLVETDCPYLAPMPYRGKRNEPAYVRYTLELLADVRGVSALELAEITTRNASRLFRIDQN